MNNIKDFKLNNEEMENLLTLIYYKECIFNVNTFKTYNRSLYDKLNNNYKNYGYSLIHEFVYMIINPDHKNECKVCCNPTTFNKRKFIYYNSCSRSCQITLSNIKSAKLHPELGKNRSKRAVETKNNTIIDGKNMHQISAQMAADNRKDKQKEMNKNVSIAYKQKRIKRENINKNKIKILINYFGINRFCKLFLNLSYKNSPYKIKQRKLEILLSINYDKFISTFEYGYLQFNVEILNNEKLFKICKICGTKYTSYDIDGFIKCGSPFTCSKKCTSLRYSQTHESPNIGRIYTDEQKLAISINLKEMWAKLSLEEKNNRIKKINDTMENKIIDGENGFKRRSKKLLLTKLKNGYINKIKDYFENPEYMEYKILYGEIQENKIFQF